MNLKDEHLTTKHFGHTNTLGHRIGTRPKKMTSLKRRNKAAYISNLNTELKKKLK